MSERLRRSTDVPPAAPAAGKHGRHRRLAPPEILFLACSLIGGAGYLLLFPPLTVADEPFHLYRAFAVTSGELFAERRDGVLGAVLPASLARMEDQFGGGWLLHMRPEWRPRPGALSEALRWPLEPQHEAFTPFLAGTLYPAVLHVPQAVGIAAGRLLGAGPVALVYLGRASNLLLCTLLIAAALRATPVGRWGLCWLALAPMALSSRASLSADALATAAAFLLLAGIARLAWGEHAPSAADRWRVAAAAVLVCLTKLPYAVLLLAVGAVGRERLGLAAHRRFWGATAVAVLAALGFSLWGSWAYQAEVWGGAPIQRGLHLRHGASAPWSVLGVVIRDYATNGRWYVAEMVGVWLGWGELVVPIALCWAFLLVLLGVLLCAERRPVGQWWQRLALAAIAMTTLIVLSAMLYIGTPGEVTDEVDLQGRYLLPVAPLGVLALTRHCRRAPPDGWLAAILATAFVAITAGVWVRIFARYYL